MAITTLAKVKTILGITTTQNDNQINALISEVENDYREIRNSAWDTGDILTITNEATTAGDITLTISDAVNDYEYNITVASGDSEMVVAQRIHDYFGGEWVKTKGDTVTFLGKAFTLSFDGGSTGVTATTSGMQIIYPDNAEYVAALMIQYHLNSGEDIGTKSWSLGDYSVTYGDTYPRAITGKIKRFVKLT